MLPVRTVHPRPLEGTAVASTGRFTRCVRGDARASNTAIRASEEDPSRVNVFAMWVTPMARGAGAGTMLLDAAVQWAARNGVREISRQVTEGNNEAKRRYEAAVFVDTGRREPLRPGAAAPMTTVMVWHGG